MTCLSCDLNNYNKFRRNHKLLETHLVQNAQPFQYITASIPRTHVYFFKLELHPFLHKINSTISIFFFLDLTQNLMWRYIIFEKYHKTKPSSRNKEPWNYSLILLSQILFFKFVKFLFFKLNFTEIRFGFILLCIGHWS